MDYKKLLLTAITLVVVDMGFLYLMGPYFGKMVKSIQGSDMVLNNLTAFITYVILVLQIYYFIISKNASYTDAFILGSTTYAIFDFTNLSVFKNYNINIALVDSIWGGILYMLVTFIFRQVERKI